MFIIIKIIIPYTATWNNKWDDGKKGWGLERDDRDWEGMGRKFRGRKGMIRIGKGWGGEGEGNWKGRGGEGRE